MARYKPYSSVQGKFIPIRFANQILPGTFENTLNYLIDHKLDLSMFGERFRNNEIGTPACDPKVLLKSGWTTTTTSPEATASRSRVISPTTSRRR